MTHTSRAGVAAVLALALIGGLAPGRLEHVRAASCITINRIYYNSPGSDDGSNTSLNAEWIRLYNSCATDKSLGTWKIKDAAGNTYTFGTYTLRSYHSVRIHTGKGTNTSLDRYWGRSQYVWNNTSDTAYVRNGAGTLKDSCSYNNSSVSAVDC